MNASTSALIVAVVGVLGTLVSGLLAHRSALRAKSIEIEHAERLHHEERSALERREGLDARRAAYTRLNQSLRHFHAVLFRQHRSHVSGSSPVPLPEEREEARRELRDVYAEAQMIVPDDVLTVAGRLVHQLSRIHHLLTQYERDSASSVDTLADIDDRLQRTSEKLYEVRQTMRKDLGITQLPIQRPDDHVPD